MRKVLFFIMIVLCLIPLTANAWEYSGTGGGGTGAYPGGGAWNSMVVGVRATAVDKQGRRLSITANGQTFISRSIDYYGNLSQISNGYYANVRASNDHSVCRLANGVQALCSKPDLESGNLVGQKGNYSYSQWPFQNIMPLPVGKHLNDYSTVNQLSNSLSQLGTSTYKAQADKLFENLMGHPISWFQQNSSGNCEENRKKLTAAFIIFEPVSQIGSFTGTASELAILFKSSSTYNWAALQQLYNALRVNPAVGNVGLEYFQPVNQMSVNSVSGVRQVKTAVANTHLGYGLAILSYGAKFVDPYGNWACYDYSIDAACVNCSAKGFDNKAYVIQDTTNWTAILNSPTSNVPNVKNYYNKGNGVFCREEYQVNFPDVEGNIKVNTGRYFTVNATDKELEALTTSAPNFKPITVTRTRQCKSSSNNINALNNFERNSRSTFKDNAGTVTLKYTENKSDSKYSKSSITLVQNKNADNTYSSNISNNMLTMTQTVSYTLKDGVYRYVRLQDGLSIYDPSGIKQSELNTKYKDIGISNLPISFENETEDSAKIADVQLSYELPSDPNSKIKAAYKKNNDYFIDTSNKNGADNVYAKAIKAGAVSDNSIISGKLDSQTYNELKQSACAKLYWNGNGYNSGLYSCVANRTKNKIGNNNDCIVQNDLNNNNAGYICPVTKKPDGGGNLCHIENGKYYLSDGTEVTKEEYEKVCDNLTPPDECENGEEPCEDGLCPEDHDGGVCPICDDGCEYGCCPSGECAPMPGGICPGTGGKNVIYRTIDLQDPFPGQNAEQRRTGSNWCSYNIRTQKINCKYNNDVSKEYIIKNGDKVYNENHVLYEVTLDSKTINSIRNYNDKHKYDDWDLTCKDNGKACVSEFLNSQVKVTGLCSNKEGKDSFYSCNKDVS